MTDRIDIRHRLLEMRRQTLDTIAAAPEIEVAWLSAIAGINAALAAIDDEERSGGAEIMIAFEPEAEIEPDNSAPKRRRGRGHRTPKTVDGLQNGNRAIARLRAQHFGDLGITRAAAEISAEGRRYQAAGWRFDRQKPISEISDERRRSFAEVLHGRSRFPGERRVRTIIRETN